MVEIILSIGAFLIALLSLLYAFHCSVVFNRFNEGIKKWAENLDNSTNAAIMRASRQILKDLDEKISEVNLTDHFKNENSVQLNSEENEPKC